VSVNLQQSHIGFVVSALQSVAEIIVVKSFIDVPTMLANSPPFFFDGIMLSLCFRQSQMLICYLQLFRNLTHVF
jgi:hypothetical protein